jgi:manganese/zinc/iron transport system substrate-binding protein|tara:strand:- start:79 stop:438 length:360 start_codon:yes stop_codon:yes gene_type:complete
LYDRRVLITAHDAFSYFGRLYNLETRSLQGISTVSEFGIKDISNLIEFIILKNIKSIFLETSVPDKPLRAVIEGCNHKSYKIFIGGGLYSDTMGNLNTFEGSYKGMLVTNTQTIVNSLK